MRGYGVVSGACITILLDSVVSVFPFNPLKQSRIYTYRLILQLVTLHFVFMAFVWFSVYTAIISLNSINQLIFVMVKCDVLFEVRTGLLNSFRREVASGTCYIALHSIVLYSNVFCCIVLLSIKQRNTC
jgi:hypothetical protein